MKKKLNANAIVLDLRRLTEETLSAYEDISLNAVITLTNSRAQALLSQAQSMLAGMDSSSAQSGAIQSAMSSLSAVINSGNPSQADVAGAMGLLTQAMAGLY